MHRCAKPHPAPVTVAKAAFDPVLRRSDGHDLRREPTFASTFRSDTPVSEEFVDNSEWQDQPRLYFGSRSLPTGSWLILGDAEFTAAS